MTIIRLTGTTTMPGLGDPGWRGAISDTDTYDLNDPAKRRTILSSAALIISGAADHLLLHQHREHLSGYVRDGGRILVNGQVVLPFIDGLARWLKLDYRSPQDLRPHALAAHPVWDGVDHRDLHFRTGVPGTHSHARLQDIGVAGFYGRGYHSPLPDGGEAVTGIGPNSLPLDYTYPLGTGEVLVHGGLDLEGFTDERYSSRRIGPNLVAWLTGSAAASDVRSTKEVPA
ncbi:hypothetical protein [Arthrobacter luteolus]|uniref:hypothetical protein n=1 Tax=Arthrobacter luteolus TaxID=98672 RepID=UPI000829965F|nr:hypothetical protein [Arthrobacter luteolus]